MKYTPPVTSTLAICWDIIRRARGVKKEREVLSEWSSDPVVECEKGQWQRPDKAETREQRTETRMANPEFYHQDTKALIGRGTERPEL
jgi:hypothetical protein